jgi:hypothetical protein
VRRTLHSSRWMVLVVVVACFGALALSACGESSSKAASEKPASVEVIKGSTYKRVTLSATAEKRLGIETAPVQVRSVGGKEQKVIPYAAVLYTPAGQPFTYTSPEPRAFVRQLIAVDRITGNRALLSKGPPAGTAVVTVGGSELFGAEYEVEEN